MFTVFAVVFEALVYITQKLCKEISNNEKYIVNYLFFTHRFLSHNF